MSKSTRMGAVFVALAFVGAIAPKAEAQAPAVVSPEVVHTGLAPTGYSVTLRVYDPTATRIRIKGEWFFSSVSDSSFSPPTSAGRLPTDWRVGDFPLGSPNSTDPNWPVVDMVKDAATGVWSYTTPLPSGWFTYALYKNCDAAAPLLAGCTATPDPSNPPWGQTIASAAPNSQVFVPSDPAFGTDDVSWQAPAPIGQRGKLEAVTYPTTQSTTPPGVHDLVVYTPPGYDPDRSTPYPLFVLSHGGGENGMGWTTQGVMQHIVDNLINAGRIQPAVIVNTNANGLSGGNPGYALDLRNGVFPYMESHYNVSKTPSGRAYAGLSAGGNRGNTLLLNNTPLLGYYGIWSCCNVAGAIPPVGDARYDNPDLKKVLGLEIAIGTQDPVRSFSEVEQAGLTAAGVPYSLYMTNGGHEWHVWRQTLREFLTKVAYRTTSISVAADPSATTATAKVSPSTAEPATPTGTVQFMAGGIPLGAPVALVDGVAKLSVTTTGGASSITAAYSGDSLYNPSTSSATPYAATSAMGTAEGSVAATLSLSLDAPAAFGPFTPGLAKVYEAATTATVISTAGDATLSVADPSAAATGHLVNGAFSLPQPLQARARNAANTGTAYTNVGPSASPLNLLTYSAPVSNDAVALQFSQAIGANDALRTGAYSKTMTFTLSTTTP